MSNTRRFPIERFYFGQLLRDGNPIGAPGVIGMTPNVGTDQIQESLRLARISPPPRGSAPDLPSTLGLFRSGQAETFILLKAQRTPEGHPMLVYWLVPEVALRWMGGNFSYFESLGYQDVQGFAQVRRDLTPLSLDDPQPYEGEDQVELLYDLFRFCGDKIKNVEGVLAALIHNQPIAILNAPQNLTQRLRFIQGLLALLPVPARTNITWASGTSNPAETLTQIKFLYNTPSPADHLVYDWAQGELLNAPPPDKYSKFIASQLRLDASLVVETTVSIAKTAIWRAMRKESLAQALYVASRRAAVDSAVQNNQPADRELVAAILRQDPTLADEMRVLYARHLVAFTLALNDQPEHADVIPLVAAANSSVAEAVMQQLRDALAQDHPLSVLNLMQRWVEHIPQTSTQGWVQIAHLAATQHVKSLLDDGQVSQVLTFLHSVTTWDARLHVEELVPRLMSVVLPMTGQEHRLVRVLFELAVRYLPAGSFQRFMSNPQVLRLIPQRLQRVVYFLAPEAQSAAPPQLLVQAVADLPPDFALLALVRLTEWALQLRRLALIDTATINGLLKVAHTPLLHQHREVFATLLAEFTPPAMLRRLDSGLLIALPQFAMLLQRPNDVVLLLERLQNEVFTVDRLPLLLDLVGKVFASAALDPAGYEAIFQRMDNSKVRLEARVRAQYAALHGARWQPEYRDLAQRLTRLLYNDPRLMPVIGAEQGLNLLRFFVVRKDAIQVLQVGSVLLELALQLEEAGVDLVISMWELLRGERQIEAAGIEIVCRYVRQADRQQAARLPRIFAQKLGPEWGERLQATYIVRLLLGDRSLIEFAEALHLAAQFFIDLATPYHESKERPPAYRIRDNLDPMSGHLSEEDRKILAEQLRFLAQSVFYIGEQRRNQRQTDQLHTALLTNEAAPQNAWDMLVFLGGYLPNTRPRP
ncbi:MAG: hypothetical protein HC915_09925 [Anaerolineae bacterium]|nr:hypothetical protein [Anaerolineae bacterium]